jgi:hypothetical protein
MTAAAAPRQVVPSKGAAQAPQVVCRLVGPILRSKYPALTAEEQAASVPLQLLCLALLDAILFHVVAAVAPETWQPVRRRLSEALIHGKQASARAAAGARPAFDQPSTINRPVFDHGKAAGACACARACASL